MSQTIGQQLEAERKSRRLTIEDVAHKTRIHRDVLGHLEADDYSKFANLMFVKSFLKIYSGHLGIDSVCAIEKLNAAGRDHSEQFLLGGIDPAIRLSYGHLSKRIPVRPILASAAAVILLAVGGSYLVSHLYGSDEDGVVRNVDTSGIGRSPRSDGDSAPPAGASTDPPPVAESKLAYTPTPTTFPKAPVRNPSGLPSPKIPATGPGGIPRAAPVIKRPTRIEITNPVSSSNEGSKSGSERYESFLDRGIVSREE